VTITHVREAFSHRVAGVVELLEFDDLVLEHLVGGLSGIVEELDRRNLHSAAQVVGNRLQQLKNIRSAQSLRHAYGTIYNQCVVLLVSYFDAAMGDLFRAATAHALRTGQQVPAGERTIELSWRHLTRPQAPVETLIAERIVDQDDISFQDMQSIRRAFSKNLAVEIGRDQDANDVILGQAARHVMAHAGGKVDERFLKQVSGASPRRLKASLPSAGTIQFEPEEVRQLASSMIAFVDQAIARLESKFGTSTEAAG
jgi:hypothetical protein